MMKMEGKYERSKYVKQHSKCVIQSSLLHDKLYVKDFFFEYTMYCLVFEYLYKMAMKDILV